jgi:hypothetical protein
MANSQASMGHYSAGNPSASAPYQSSVPQGQGGSIGAAREVHSSSANVDRRQAATGSQGAAWKVDSEEMLKARKSAQRVILSKFKAIWPSDDDAKLAARAFDFERGEYEVVLGSALALNLKSTHFFEHEGDKL